MEEFSVCLTDLQSARLASLGGRLWLQQLVKVILASPPPPVLFHPEPPHGSVPPPPPPSDQTATVERIAETTSRILEYTSHVSTLFRGGNSKLKGNAGEIAYLALLTTAFPKVFFDERAAREGRSGDIRADFQDGHSILIEAKVRVGNVPKTDVDAFHAHMRQRCQHGIMLNAESGIVYRPHRFNVDIIPADDRQLVAIYLPNNGGDMDTVGLAFNLIRKISPVLDALQGNELVFSLELCEEVNKIIAARCKTLRAAHATNRSMMALVEKQAKEIEGSMLDDVSSIFSSACARVKTLMPAQRPLRLTANDIV